MLQLPRLCPPFLPYPSYYVFIHMALHVHANFSSQDYLLRHMKMEEKMASQLSPVMMPPLEDASGQALQPLPKTASMTGGPSPLPPIPAEPPLRSVAD